jgi:hypothetical protein
MNAAALTARMRRLDQLVLGVTREIQFERKTDIFLWQERLEYRGVLGPISPLGGQCVVSNRVLLPASAPHTA